MKPAADLRQARDGADPGLKRLQAVLDAMPIGVSWATLAGRRIVYANREFTRMFGYTVEDLRDVLEWRKKAYPYAEDAEMVENRWRQIWNAPEPVACELEPMEVQIRCKDGSIKTVLHRGTSLPENGWALATYVDITERKRNEVALHQAERLARENEAVYRLLLDNSPEMTVLASADGSFQYVSPAVVAITGFTPAEFLPFRPEEITHPEDMEGVHQALRGIRPSEPGRTFRHRILQKAGGYRWVEGSVRAFADPATGQLAGFVTSVRDISEQKEREDRLASEVRQMSQAATLDELTGIANRRAFNQRFEDESRRVDCPRVELSLLMLDVDLFKQFNDLYGHIAGDECLKHVAETLKMTIQRDADLVARYGGEEFVVLLPGTNPAGASRVAKNILAAVEALGITHAGSPYSVLTVSIGVASRCGAAPIDRGSLLEEVDAALYAAKRSGRNRICVAEEGMAAR